MMKLVVLVMVIVIAMSLVGCTKTTRVKAYTYDEETGETIFGTKVCTYVGDTLIRENFVVEEFIEEDVIREEYYR